MIQLFKLFIIFLISLSLPKSVTKHPNTIWLLIDIQYILLADSRVCSKPKSFKHKKPLCSTTVHKTVRTCVQAKQIDKSDEAPVY